MKKSLLLLALVGALWSCRKEPNLSQLSDDPLVATQFDRSADFSSYATYELPTYVALLGNGSNDTLLSNSDANQILNRIRQNMDRRGYSEAASTDTGDLAMNVFVINTQNTGSVVTPGYWWGSAGYYDPYYWGYYDSYYYYPFSYSYTYNTGTLIMELVDLKNDDLNNNRLIVIWNSLANGLLYNYSATNMQNALSSIDQSFTQSPYLTR